MVAAFLQRLPRDRIQKWPERDHASMEYEHVAVTPVGDPAKKGPDVIVWISEKAEESMTPKRTTSLDSLISTHSLVNSHTSRKRTLMASASALASVADLISKRKTKSPPYLSSNDGGGFEVGMGV